MTPHSILAVTDFSPQGDNALYRAALLSAEHGATLKLVYLAYPGEAPPQMRQPASRTTLCSSASAMTSACVPSAGSPSPWMTCSQRLAAQTCSSGARRRCERLRSFFMGQPVEGCCEGAAGPVLVVRTPGRACLSQPDRCSRLHGSVARPRRPRVCAQQVMRRSSCSMRSAPPTRASFATQRSRTMPSRPTASECRRYAQDRMFWLTDSYDARRNRVLSAIGHGDPARQMVVQQQNSGAELIVVGKHPSSQQWTSSSKALPKACSVTAPVMSWWCPAPFGRPRAQLQPTGSRQGLGLCAGCGLAHRRRLPSRRQPRCQGGA